MDKSTTEVRLQKWSAEITECNNSGLSKKEWCRRNGISTKTFCARFGEVKMSKIKYTEEEIVEAGLNMYLCSMIHSNNTVPLLHPWYQSLRPKPRLDRSSIPCIDDLSLFLPREKPYG